MHVWKFRMGGNERLLSAVPRDRTRGSGHQLKHIKFPLNYLIHEDSQALAQVAWGGCGVSVRSQTQLGTVPAPAPALIPWSQGLRLKAGTALPKTHLSPLPPPPEHLTVFRTLTYIRFLGSAAFTYETKPRLLGNVIINSAVNLL